MYFFYYLFISKGRRPFEVAVNDKPQNHRKRVNFEVGQTLTIYSHVQSSYKCVTDLVQKSEDRL